LKASSTTSTSTIKHIVY